MTNPSPQRMRYFVILGLLLLLSSGCGQQELSKTGYESAKALYSICNQKSETRLLKLKQSLEHADVPSQESATLLEIIAGAEQGDWNEAMQSARDLMESQIKRP